MAIPLGTVFGNLTVIAEAPRNKFGHVCYTVKCRCGNTKIKNASDIRIFLTRSVKNNSCGNCQVLVAYVKHYRAWTNMKSRCYNPRHRSYHLYGGRGIKVCEDWRYNFWNFYDYIGLPPSPDHSIEREDNNGNYEPGNVCWGTPLEQTKNRRWHNRTMTSTRV